MNMLMDIFECIKDMAVEVSMVIFVVFLCRCLIRKASKSLAYLLWGVVALRLIFPNMIVSEFSLFQYRNLITERTESYISEETNQPVIESETITNKIEATTNKSETSQGLNATADTQQKNTFISCQQAVNLWENLKKLSQTQYAMWIWLGGVILMWGYGITSYLFLKRKLRFATKLKDNIYESSIIQSPFILGIIKPKIYLNCHLEEKEQEYILKHEQYHMKRKDYLVKVLAFILLGIYWFHPLVWLAFYYMNCDMEMSCDEKVLAKESELVKKEYSRLLLKFARGEKNYPIISISFGENDTRKRVKHILNYKKPVIGISALAAVIVVVVLGICLTDAPKEEKTFPTDTEEQEETSFSKNERLTYDVALKMFASYPDTQEDVKKIEDVMAVTNEDDKVIHVELWKEFYEKVQKNEEAELKIAQFTTEGDVIYTYLSYNGTDFYGVVDQSRDKYLGDQEKYNEFQFTNMFVTEDEVTSSGDKYLKVILNNDPELTEKEMEQRLLSSQYSPDMPQIYFLLYARLTD